MSIEDKDVESLKYIIDHAPVTISWVTKDLVYLGVNQVLSEICGLAPEEFIGEKVGFMTDQGFFFEFSKELFDSPLEMIEKEIYVQMNDQERFFHLQGKKYDNGNKAIVIGSEITELKEAQGQALANEKMAMVGEMTASIVHDISNPLTTIAARVSGLKKIDFGKNEELKTEVLNVADQIQLAEQRVARLVNAMRNFSRQSRQEPFAWHNVSVIVKESIELCQGKIQSLPNLHIEIDGDPEMEIFCRDLEISQVIVNLISNAIDAICENPVLLEGQYSWILIKWKKLSHIMNISVTDSGPGIPDAIKGKILTPFFSTKPKGKGTGLGLSLSQNIARDHGGNLFLDKTSKQTRFILSLPQK